MKRLVFFAIVLSALTHGWGASAWAQGKGPRQVATVRVDAVRSEPLSQTIPVIGRLVARQAGVVAALTRGGVLEEPCRDALQTFFRDKRTKRREA